MKYLGGRAHKEWLKTETYKFRLMKLFTDYIIEIKQVMDFILMSHLKW